ncbi:MAG: alpha-L-rhamnosidase N-terminal domain-containing protein [Verrucomicrobiota bacterium]
MKSPFCLHVCAGLVLGLFLVAARGANLEPSLPPLRAQWIWLRDGNVRAYNQTVIARRQVRLEKTQQATLRITADSFYRVFVNNVWVNDGPARAWPEHFQYDVLDVTPCLVDGPNEIRIVARYYGVGDFHRVPQQAGLLAQLDLTLTGGRTRTLVTDGDWEVAAAPAWIANTPKVSIQMEPMEVYDARLEDNLHYRRAAVLFATGGGPWKDLRPRETALLTKQPVAFRRFLGAHVVKADGWNYLLPAARLVNPGVIEANGNVSQACGMATVLEGLQTNTVRLETEGMNVAIDGRRQERNEFTLAPGRHLVVALVSDLVGHEKHKGVRFPNPAGFRLENPLQPGHENPWVFLRFPEYAFATNDVRWIVFWNEDRRLSGLTERFNQAADRWLGSVKDLAAFREQLESHAVVMASAAMFLVDPTWQFQERQVVNDATALVRRPAGLIHNNDDATLIRPSPAGDVELLYDLGEQDCGCYQLEMQADAGVEVDVFGVEYIAPDGRIQHTGGNRNGMRYITRAGDNRFTSLKRRSGRYLFVTLRHQRSPVSIRHLQLIESTYPVEAVGSFACSDARLNEVWAISTRTLKLCMEDTFTDCPLYEQTHWVGDARNESLIAYSVFGVTDLPRRCINVTAQSLARYPFAGCQTPSSWECLLPAWSFLWGISTWDYYWFTGDREYLRGIYPDVIRNLKGAETFVSERDLFTGPFWNFFDWVNLDQGPKAVVHNSMFMIGAIDAALKEAAVLGDTTHVPWLRQLRARLVRGVNRLWDADRKAYPDSIHDDGAVSPSSSQHTSFLSLLYDIVEPANRAVVEGYLSDPPASLVKIGSPFAMLYLYETYEKLGREDEIIKSIFQNYLPMIEAGATTVWESFPTGTTGSGGFPTRSHCHAWSSAPSRFLPRIILGVKETAAGGTNYRISPRLSGLTWARGTVATVHGPISVSWKRTGGDLELTYAAPADVAVEFVGNPTLEGLKVTVNGVRR